MLALCTFFLICSTSQASYPQIVGYEPGSDVQQHSLIDLDQQEMETHLAASPPDFNAARSIYTTGANSGGYAQFTVSPLTAVLAKGATVTQAGNAGATGYAKSAASAGATTVKVSYTSKCKMGGSSSPDTSGCFTASGALSVAGVVIGTPSLVTNKYRTLSGFSTQAEAKMAGQEYYAAYRAYYNEGDYADRFVMSALNGAGVFSGKDAISRIEGAKKGSAYQNVWMYVIREMEDAIMDCNNGCIGCNDDPVHAWDEAVAFYAGSLEGPAGDSAGKLLYRLAEKRCANFGTCTGVAGKAAVNSKIVEQFRYGQVALTQGRCVEVIPIKRRIVELMSVPLVQGALRYAYKIEHGTVGGTSKEKAEGAAFSAAILPHVAQCNSDAAKIISGDMAMNAVPPMQKSGFAAVKQAFESTYACMGVTCADVGGILSGNALAGACVDPGVSVTQTKEEVFPVWAIVVLVVVIVSLIAVCVVACLLRNQALQYETMVETGEKGDKKPSEEYVWPAFEGESKGEKGDMDVEASLGDVAVVAINTESSNGEQGDMDVEASLGDMVKKTTTVSL